MRLLITLLVVVGGVGLSLQAAMNTRLRGATGSPVTSALISFAVGAAVLSVLTLFGVLGRGRLPAFGDVPPWAWLGGVVGAFFVTLVVIAVPRVGTAVVVAAAILGQLGAALALDTFGWMDVPRLALSPARLVGALFLTVGVVLMAWKR